MDPKQLLDHFSSHLKNVIAKAISVSASFSHSEVMPAHLLLALVQEKGSIASQLLEKSEVSSKTILSYLKSITKQLPAMDIATRAAIATLPELSKSSKRVLEKAMLTGYENEHTHVGTEHLLYGLLQSRDVGIKEILSKTKIKRKEMTQQLEIIFTSTNKFPDVQDIAEAMGHIEELAEGGGALAITPEKSKTQKKSRTQKYQALSMFAVELTDVDVQKTIDPVIGRENEIERLIHVLSRRNKNNPILVGEPGVGKTAIVEGLAKRVSEGKVPAVLQNKKIFALDLTLLVAGTIYRGEFEARIKQLVDEVSSRSDFILFIDEIHNIIGTGSNQGTMDAANILKPALARGKLRCIGATTHDEYKKYVTADPALERRFQAVNVEEPSREEAIEILKGVKKYYDEFHGASISDSAITTAVDLSMRYIHDNYLPDKAIDLIDEASASVRTKKKPTPLQKKRLGIIKELNSIRKDKDTAMASEDLDSATVLKKRLDDLEEKIESLEKQTKKTKKVARSRVTKSDVIEVLANRLGLNKKLLEENQWSKLQTLSDRLSNHIVGQDTVLNKLERVLKQAHLGIRDKNKPLSSLLFVGPSGVGKTELAKSLAKELYHDEKSLIRLDMSEFAEGHGVSKLLGSPAGYVGYKDRNHFIDKLKQRPYSVVLFDEFDKAHPDVMKLLLQILDEGTLTDSNGKKVHFCHSTVILTSNVGAELYKKSGFGFGSSKQKSVEGTKKRDEAISSKLRDVFGTPLLGRLHEVCIFSPLTNENIMEIISRHAIKISSDLKTQQDIALTLTKTAIKQLAIDSKHDDLGARNVERIVDHVIQDLVVGELQKESKKKQYRLSHKQSAYYLQ